MIANSLVVLALWLVFGAATAVVYVRLMGRRRLSRPQTPPRGDEREDEREGEPGRHEVAR